jgi:hypothetical protein
MQDVRRHVVGAPASLPQPRSPSGANRLGTDSEFAASFPAMLPLRPMASGQEPTYSSHCLRPTTVPAWPVRFRAVSSAYSHSVSAPRREPIPDPAQARRYFYEGLRIFGRGAAVVKRSSRRPPARRDSQRGRGRCGRPAGRPRARSTGTGAASGGDPPGDGESEQHVAGRG